MLPSQAPRWTGTAHRSDAPGKARTILSRQLWISSGRTAPGVLVFHGNPPSLERQVGELIEGHPLQVGMGERIRLPLPFQAQRILRLQGAGKAFKQFAGVQHAYRLLHLRQRRNGVFLHASVGKLYAQPEPLPPEWPSRS